jgi:hypothetical protein
MINNVINNLIAEANNAKPSIEVLDKNRIDITSDVKVIGFKVPKLSNTCPNGFKTDKGSGYCVAINSKISKPFPKLGVTCPTGYTTDTTSGYCKRTNTK